jgi:hypothetical protein
MNKYIKILLGLLLFSLTLSITIYYILGTIVDMSEIIICMFFFIYGGAFTAILVTYKKFRKLSYIHIGFRFFAILCASSVVTFIVPSYLIGTTAIIQFKDGSTQEQVRMAYINYGILSYMPVKIYVSSFIGMLLAIKTTD